jgi:hypothetical protein
VFASAPRRLRRFSEEIAEEAKGVFIAHQMMAQYADGPATLGARRGQFLHQPSDEHAMVAAGIAGMRIDDVDMGIDDGEPRP